MASSRLPLGGAHGHQNGNYVSQPPCGRVARSLSSGQWGVCPVPTLWSRLRGGSSRDVTARNKRLCCLGHRGLSHYGLCSIPTKFATSAPLRAQFRGTDHPTPLDS